MKKNVIIIIILIAVGILSSNAQINIGGEPLSFKFENKSLSIDDIPVITLPSLDNTKLIAEAELNERKDQPWQFGKNIDVSINIKEQAKIDELKNGTLFRLKIITEDALTINLRFSKYQLPKGATLYIYNSEKSDIIGGFTEANNQEDYIFATGLIKGDQIVIEYYEPNDVNLEGDLIINRITHGFRGLNEYTKSFEESGLCNINVSCDDGTWSNEIKSACMIITGGSSLCSGALINNTQEDGTPYILTANHCSIEPSSMVYMFNWESDNCNNPPSSPDHDDISGSVLIARDYDSDFCLLEMNLEPPFDYYVYYSGWSTDDVASTNSVGIHHPSGDIKKISYDDNQPVSDYYLGSGGAQDSHWKVIWDSGTTEGGSSGSPLFNEDNRIIGQLHGGWASCTDLNEPDWYGKFSYSWNSGATAETRLKDWLDPNNIGITNMNGYDPNVPLADNDAHLALIYVPSDQVFGTSQFSPSFLIRNRGNNNLLSVDLKYSIDNSQVQTIHWIGNLQFAETENVVFEPISLSTGDHSIVAYVENPNGVQDQYLFNDTIKKDFTVYETIFEDDFESGNYWYLTGEFQIDEPNGLGGEKGYSDPESAYSGSNVLGTDLTGLGQHIGDYENNIELNEDYAISQMINCINYENVTLTFKRWLGIDINNSDNAKIEIYSDEIWNTIWSNSSTTISDASWISEKIDISEFADGKNISVRFTMGPTNHADQYCGWNIDNFQISGIRNQIDTQKQKTVLIYPNPAESYFYIELTDEIVNNVHITLTDLNGKIVFEKQISENEIKAIETSSYKKNTILIQAQDELFGIFILKIKTDNGEFVNKIVLM